VDVDLAATRRKQLTRITPLFTNRRPEFYKELVRRV
jgi:hypothetical protein